MKPITEYKDYRLYMQDFYEERKRTSAFSWREFSKLAGFKSPVYLKLVCEGKSSLSFVKMEQVAHAMGLAGHEFAYFTQMVKFGNATKDSVKKEALLEMQKIAREHQVRVVDAESFEFYESWKNPTIRELAPMMPGKRPLEMAKTCHQVISAEQVRDSLATRLRSWCRRGFSSARRNILMCRRKRLSSAQKNRFPLRFAACTKKWLRLRERLSTSSRLKNVISRVQRLGFVKKPMPAFRRN